MAGQTDILCIGSVLWDMIGRAPSHMRQGSDVPGRIVRIPGGVALNAATTLQRFGLRPILLSAVGQDRPGDELLQECARMGIETDHVYRADDMPTDRYMAVEGSNGLIAAIADAQTLEAAGTRILRPLTDGSLADAAKPFTGPVALDGNLTQSQLLDIAEGDMLAAADLRVAPASPGKAQRLLPFLQNGKGTLYVNLEEAGLLCQQAFTSAAVAAEALLERGAARAVVTHGSDTAADASPAGTLTGTPPEVTITRVTGAGDTFMAAHIATECMGEDRATALHRALHAAARHISGETAP